MINLGKDKTTGIQSFKHTQKCDFSRKSGSRDYSGRLKDYFGDLILTLGMSCVN